MSNGHVHRQWNVIWCCGWCVVVRVSVSVDVEDERNACICAQVLAGTQTVCGTDELEDE